MISQTPPTHPLIIFLKNVQETPQIHTKKAELGLYPDTNFEFLDFFLDKSYLLVLFSSAKHEGSICSFVK